MYAIVKTIEEANQLNSYIRDWYYTDVTNACFDKWTDIIEVDNGYALQIMPEWKDYTVPEFVVNGMLFVDEIEDNKYKDVIGIL